MIIDDNSVKIDCAVIEAGIGTAAPRTPEAAKAQRPLIDQFGPLSVLALHGLHPNGAQCESRKLIGWEALAVIVGVADALAEQWPVHVRDQYRARVADITAEARREFPPAS